MRAVMGLLGLFLVPGVAAAVMPPHLTDSVPPDGGVLSGDVVILKGFSLGLGASDVHLTDAAGEAVPTTVETRCEWVGEGDCPGCKQQRCTLMVRLLRVVPGLAYTLSAGREVVHFTVAPAPPAPPVAPAPPAPPAPPVAP